MNARQRRVALRLATRLNEQAYGRKLKPVERYAMRHGSWYSNVPFRVSRHASVRS